MWKHRYSKCALLRIHLKLVTERNHSPVYAGTNWEVTACSVDSFYHNKPQRGTLIKWYSHVIRLKTLSIWSKVEMQQTRNPKSMQTHHVPTHLTDMTNSWRPTVEDQHRFRSNIDRVNGLEHQKLKGTAMLWWLISHCEHIHLPSAHICHLLHWYTLTHSTTYCTGTQCNILCIVNNTWQVIVKVSQPKHQVYHWSLICIVFVASKSSKEHSTVVTQVSLLTLYYLCRAYPNALRKLRNCWCNKVFVLQSASYN